jgi:CheY-like chemotaxis protein
MVGVLVVEDDPEMRETLASVLAANGYAPAVAADGREALQTLRTMNQRPAVILLDASMPVMDGLEFRAAQQADPALQSIPVIIMSGDIDSAARLAALGAAAFLQKPIHVSVLLSAVSAVCSVFTLTGSQPSEVGIDYRASGSPGTPATKRFTNT